jgi:curved DNA-binding protein CbpA
LSDNPYDVLGVKPSTSSDEIQKAYRRLAKKFHPDLNPGNQRAEEQFKRVSAAYDLLGDPEKRARFDRGEIDASGAERPAQHFDRDFAHAGADHPYASRAGFEDFMGSDDILSELLRRGSRTAFRMTKESSDWVLRLQLGDRPHAEEGTDAEYEGRGEHRKDAGDQ